MRALVPLLRIARRGRVRTDRARAARPAGPGHSAVQGIVRTGRPAEHGFGRADRPAEQGFTPAKRSAEHGFMSKGRSAEHGFTPAKRSAEHGFTLVELMVVIVIIGLLTTIVVINVLPSQGRARVAKAKADVALIEQGLEMYRLDNLNYPTTAQGLQVLTGAGNGTGTSRPGGYLKKLPDDPWGAPYQYAFPGRHGPFDVYSFGADGHEGGTGDDADIGNWK